MQSTMLMLTIQYPKQKPMFHSLQLKDLYHALQTIGKLYVQCYEEFNNNSFLTYERSL